MILSSFFEVKVDGAETSSGVEDNQHTWIEWMKMMSSGTEARS